MSGYQRYIKPKLESDEDYKNNFYAKRMRNIRKCNNERYSKDEQFRELKKQQALQRYYINKEKNNNHNLERYYEKKAIDFFSTLFD